MAGLLAGVTVVETGGGLSVPFAGRLLARLDATVIKAEPPGGDPLAEAPAGSVQHALASYLSAGKWRLELPAAPAPAQTELRGVLDEAAAWLDARPAGEITADELAALHRDGSALPGLTHVTVTPFGLTGPWSGAPGSALVASAVGGFLWLCGEPEREPLRNGGHLPEFQAGLFAALAAVAGVLSTESGERGSLVDLSLLEAVIAFHERGDLAVTHLERDLVRSRRHEATHPFTILPCGDGFISLAVGTPRQWQNLCVLIGKPEWADDPELLLNRLAHADEIDAVLLPWLADRTAAEVTATFQELLIACGPVLTASQVLGDAQLHERQFFEAMEVEGQTLNLPGVPLRVDGAPLRPAAEAPP